MRFKLLRRRLTISAPRMAVRSALPWPFRWAVLALMFGFCAAIALWAFEFGKEIAGLEQFSKEDFLTLRNELSALKTELARVKDERDKAQGIANTSETALTTERAAQEWLTAQNKQLDAENRGLRDDLGFFEKLIPATGGETIAIRGLQAEVVNGHQVKWQVLVIQPQKNAAEFNGRLELTFAGLQGGKPWAGALPEGAQALRLKQYGRLEGMMELPPQTVLKSVSAKVMDGSATRAQQSVKL
jgi:hypothetical protein